MNTRQERREKKRNKLRKFKVHSKELGEIYKNATKKRERLLKE
jgi:hypothetical protein